MNERCYCIKCGDDYLPHQTIIAEIERKRCICLNCWAVLQKLEKTVNEKTNIQECDCNISCSNCGGECIREENCPENWVCQDLDCEVHKNE